MSISSQLVDAAEELLASLKQDTQVAYAEVGGVVRNQTSIATTLERVREATTVSEAGVWCRVFADGAAGYRYTTELDDVESIGERARKRATALGQSMPAQYDPITAHKGSHPGWTTNRRNVDVDIDEKVDALRQNRNRLEEFDSVRMTYEDSTRHDVLLTTTGGMVRTTLDWNWLDCRCSLRHSGGDKLSLRRRVGNTRGFGGTESDLFDRAVSDLEERRERLAGHETTTATGEHDVVLGGTAAGRLFHQLSRYLEMDTVYFGSSPVDVGDTLLSTEVTIDDTVTPGNWAARGYDAEGRTTVPTTLVDDGVVTDRLHSTATALEEDTVPKGNFVPATNPDSPPRIHTRHLSIEPGDRSLQTMCESASIFVAAFGTPTIEHEATRTKLSSYMPPSSLYATDIASQTPTEYENEALNQRVRLPVQEGYLLEDGHRVAAVTDMSIVISLSDLQTITALGCRRTTIDGRCRKNGSRIPFSVTSPPIRFRTTVREDR